MPSYRTLGFSSYDEYLKSGRWKARPAAYARIFPRRCFVCGTNSRCQLHHKTYLNLGSEKDCDLEWLCARHHEEVHDDGKVMLPKKNRLVEMKAAWNSRTAGRASGAVHDKRQKPKTQHKPVFLGDLSFVVAHSKNPSVTASWARDIQILADKYGHRREELELLNRMQIVNKLRGHQAVRQRAEKEQREIARLSSLIDEPQQQMLIALGMPQEDALKVLQRNYSATKKVLLAVLKKKSITASVPQIRNESQGHKKLSNKQVASLSLMNFPCEEARKLQRNHWVHIYKFVRQTYLDSRDVHTLTAEAVMKSVGLEGGPQIVKYDSCHAA